MGAADSTEDINMKINREKHHRDGTVTATTATAAALKSAKHQSAQRELKSVAHLLQFWCTCLAATELVPTAAAAIAAGSTRSTSTSEDDSSRTALGVTTAKLPFSVLGLPTLQAIISSVCSFFAALSNTNNANSGGGIMNSESGDNNILMTASRDFSISTWRNMVQVLVLALGPIFNTGNKTICLSPGKDLW